MQPCNSTNFNNCLTSKKVNLHPEKKKKINQIIIIIMKSFKHVLNFKEPLQFNLREGFIKIAIQINEKTLKRISPTRLFMYKNM